MEDPTKTDPAHRPLHDTELELERIRHHRQALQARHSQALARLMAERQDLRGVHALADLVDDSLRWSA